MSTHAGHDEVAQRFGRYVDCGVGGGGVLAAILPTQQGKIGVGARQVCSRPQPGNDAQVAYAGAQTLRGHQG